MALIDSIPVEARWSMAAKGLLGVYVAATGVLGYANGLQFYGNFSRKAWADLGARGGDFCEAFNLPGRNARDILRVSMVYAMSLLGPEFEFETVEESDNLAVGRTYRCPFIARVKKFGMAEPRCSEGHQSWGASLMRSVNPDFSFKLTKTMSRGYPYCEWVIERKNRMEAFLRYS